MYDEIAEDGSCFDCGMIGQNYEESVEKGYGVCAKCHFDRK